MKKIFAAVILGLISLTIVACSSQQNSEENFTESLAQITTAIAPYSATDCEGKEQASVENDFSSAGFANISSKKIEDLGYAEADKVGSVISVSIGGQTDFSQGQEFDKNDEVVITSHAFKKCSVTMHVTFIPNLIFSKYDVNLIMNDASQGTLEHGEDKDFEFLLEPGEYTFTFVEDGDTEVNGSTVLTVKGDLDVSLEISCHSDGIDVEVTQIEDLEATRQAQALEEALEAKLPKEMARRAVVVAMTNCQATDVFTDDGNSYDPTKFHSYSDIDGFFMTVESDGTWTAADEETWHVDGIVLRIFGYDTYLKATGDIRKDGDNYIVSNVDRTISTQEDFDSDDFANKEHFEPSESNPFLTVPNALIAEDRDTEAAEDKMTAKEERQAWIENQFNWWDGRHTELSELIKECLNDEDSFEHVDASYIDVCDEASQAVVNQTLKDVGLSEEVEIGDLFVIEVFSAKNAFNATIKNTAYGIVRGSDNSVILLGIA